ncbi:MAG: serine/threonine protein kinase [Deltaproteobacteria bacterium]|nr:serine/threonine protein kinase [Deltaproteobacteria bacterium]
MVARACLTPQEIDAHLRAVPGDTADLAVMQHLTGCAACRARVEAMRLGSDITAPGQKGEQLNTQRLPAILQMATDSGVVATEPPIVPPPALTVGGVFSRGASVGRFILIDVLGQGGMGNVYLAYDPQLDRRVALKLLRPDGIHGEPDALLRARLAREAQAMARLSHPNVVAVYDEGDWGDQVFLAMEYVNGPTLADWTKAQKRSWRDVLAMYLGAGRGLAAAHTAGLVHRDFKPENVLVDPNGTPKVTDFGLAHLDGRVPTAMPQQLVTAGLLVTTPGELLGTPAYMAPEQFAGKEVDTRSDQFSFCTALYEALYGERAFGGKDFQGMGEAVLRGEVRPAPKGSPVPARVREILLRGLAVDPAARHPSMEALLQALSEDPARRIRHVAERAALAAVALAAVGVAAGVLYRDRTRCEREAPTGSWGLLQSAALRTRLTTAGRSAQGEALATAVDAYVADAHQQQIETCQEARSGTIDPGTAELRQRCLEEALVRAETATTIVESDPSLTAEHLAQRLRGAWNLVGCEKLTSPRHHWLEERQRFQADLTRIGTLSELGQAERARAEAEKLEALAVDAGATAVQAAAMFARAESSMLRQERLEETVRLFHQAALLAEAAGDDTQAANARVYELQTVGVIMNRFDEGDRIAAEARAAVERAGNPPELRCTLDQVLGSMAINRGDPKATEQMRKALKEFEDAYGPQNPMLVNPYSELARAMAMIDGDPAGAAQQFMRAAAVVEANPGVDREQNLNMYDNAGICLLSSDKPQEAQAAFDKAAPLAEEFAASWPTDVGQYLVNRAAVPIEQGKDLESAAADLERGEKILAGHEVGPDFWMLDHLLRARLARLHSNVSVARAEAEQALFFAGKPPNGEDELADARMELALDLADSEPTRARELAEQALARFKKRHLPIHVRRTREAESLLNALKK